jgi:hypothetical protein
MPGHGFQTKVATDAVLDVNNEITVVQICEINLHCRTHCLCVWRLEPARALNPVTSEDFRVGNNNESGFIA